MVITLPFITNDRKQTYERFMQDGGLRLIESVSCWVTPPQDERKVNTTPRAVSLLLDTVLSDRNVQTNVTRCHRCGDQRRRLQEAVVAQDGGDVRRRTAGPEASRLPHDEKAVSYTHLDVYKRQV